MATTLDDSLFTCPMSKKWKHAIVVGASSGIGEAIVYELAKQGVSVGLVARRGDQLEKVAQKANTISPTQNPIPNTQYPTFVHDVTNFSEVPALFQEITKQLGGLDLIIYNSGIMPAVGKDEYNFEKDKSIIETNLLGAFA